MKSRVLIATLIATGLVGSSSLAQTPPPPPGNSTPGGQSPAAPAPGPAMPPPSAVPTQPGAPPVAATSHAEARQHYQSGTKLFSEADFAGALVEFQRAYSIAPNYRVLFDIAQSHYQLLNYADALTQFERFLSQGGEEINPARRADVEREVRELKNRVAYVTVTVATPDAEVLVDDRVVGMTPLPSAVRVSAGKRRLRARKTGMVGDERDLDVAGGDRTEITLKLVDAKTIVQVQGRRFPIVPVTLGIATGAFAIGTATFGALALQASKDWQTLRTTSSVTQSASDSAISKAKNYGLATDVLGALTIVGAGTTLYFALRPSRDEGKDRVSAGWVPKVGVGFASAKLDFTF